MHKSFFKILGAVFALGFALNAHAEWPERAIKLIAPFPPGNSSDVVARLVGEKLASRLGQPVVVDNRAGAGGTLGTAYGATQPADGHTLLIGAPGALSVAPFVRAAPLPYDPVKDFVVLGAIAWAPQVLVVRKDFPANSFKEFVSHAKKPGVHLNFGFGGIGTTVHLVMAQVFNLTGIQANLIPYQGGAQVINDLRGGIIDFTLDTVAGAHGMLADGSIKALGVTTAQRVPSLPNVPTLKEQGADVDVQGYILIVAPAKLPEAVTLRLRAALQAIGQEPEVRKRLIDLGLTPMEVPKEQLADFIRTESVKWKKLVELAGVAKSQ